MNNRSKILLYILGGLIVLLLLLEMLAPKPLNWRESYTSTDKIPFGAYILYDQLEDLFAGHEVESVNEDPTRFFKEHKNDSVSNYLFINDFIGLDRGEVNDALEYVSRGNKLFIATKKIAGALADSLKVESSYSYGFYESDTIAVRLNNKSFKDQSYVYSRGSLYSYITNYDSTRTKVLGEVLPFEPEKDLLKKVLGNNSKDTINNGKPSVQEKILKATKEKSNNRSIPQVNFIEVKVGKGAVYYHLNPIAFTNYYMLEPGKEAYVAASLSYLNNGPVYFDNYGKSGKRVITTPMRFILSQPPLRWAWYLLLASVVFYFLFKVKREQRAIPVVKPLENSSVEFTRTIGNLYFQNNDYSSAINRKINYFLERVRTTMYLDTSRLDEQFIAKLAVKAMKPHDETTILVHTIIAMRHDGPHSEEQLKQLNARLEAFLKE